MLEGVYSEGDAKQSKLDASLLSKEEKRIIVKIIKAARRQKRAIRTS